VAQRDEIRLQLQDAIRALWQGEPDDVRRLREEVVGAYRHSAPVILYAESETREFIDYLWTLRRLMKSPEVSLASVSTIVSTLLELKADKWDRWYKLKDVPRALRGVAEALRSFEGTEEEYIELIDLLLLYIGKFNFWLDANIPWLAVSTAFDYQLHGR